MLDPYNEHHPETGYASDLLDAIHQVEEALQRAIIPKPVMHPISQLIQTPPVI